VVAFGTTACSTKEADCKALIDVAEDVGGELKVDLSDDKNSEKKLEKVKKAQGRAKKALKALKKAKVEDEEIKELREDFNKSVKKVVEEADVLVEFLEIGVKTTKQLAQLVTAVQATKPAMNAAMAKMSGYELRRLANQLAPVDREFPGKKPADYYDKTAAVVLAFKARDPEANAKLAAWGKSLKERAKALRDTKDLQAALDKQVEESEEARKAYTSAQKGVLERYEAIEDACEE